MEPIGRRGGDEDGDEKELEEAEAEARGEEVTLEVLRVEEVPRVDENVAR